MYPSSASLLEAIITFSLTKWKHQGFQCLDLFVAAGHNMSITRHILIFYFWNCVPPSPPFSVSHTNKPCAFYTQVIYIKHLSFIFSLVWTARADCVERKSHVLRYYVPPFFKAYTSQGWHGVVGHHFLHQQQLSHRFIVLESQVTKNPKCSVDLGDFIKHPSTEEREAKWDELVWGQKTGIGVFFGYWIKTKVTAANEIFWTHGLMWPLFEIQEVSTPCPENM